VSKFSQNFLKSIDKILGKFLVKICRKTKRFQKRVPQEIKEKYTVLIIRPGGLGDAVLLTPMVMLIREKLKDKVQIHYLGEKRNVEGAKFCYGDMIERFFVYDSLSFLLFLFRNIKKYDFVLDTEQSFLLPAFFANILGKKVIGFAGTEKEHVFDIKVEYFFSRFEAVNFFRLGLALILTIEQKDFDEKEHWGISDEDVISYFRLSKKYVQKKSSVAQLEGGQKKRIDVLFAPYTTRKEKMCLSLFEIIEEMRQKGYKIEVVGDRKLMFQDILKMMEESRVFVSVDNGILHFSNFVDGLKVVALFGPTNHLKWAPPNAFVLRKYLWCSPCSKYAQIPPCPRNIECMKIEKSELKKVILSFLQDVS
jgi:ADP-heptose:LPS heptosyltransferase